MNNLEIPINLEQQVALMKKYVRFTRKEKMREFLKYAGYFRASRYGKYMLSKVNSLGSKADANNFFELYDFDVKLRQLLFKYCKNAEIYFKSSLANAISLKTGDAAFYLDKSSYTPSKGERNKLYRQKNERFFSSSFFKGLLDKEKKLRTDRLKHPELKEYRKGGSRQKNKLPVWAAFSYFDFGEVVMMYSYLRGDFRKEVLKHAYAKNAYGKDATKQVDTWLDAIRNLRNYCAHHSMVVGMTSSVVIIDDNDDGKLLPSNTDLYSRLYALKKILPQKDAVKLGEELSKFISKSKVDVYKMEILPSNWKELYDQIAML